MVRDESAAEDLAQDAFSRAFSGLSDYRAEASPRTWLMTIARHRCIDHLRRQQVQPWSIPEEPDTEDAPDVGPLPATLLTNRELVLRGLDALDESHRALVILRYRHGMDYAELASAFGLKVGTVRMRVSRALAKMRSTIEGPPAPPMAAAPARAAAQRIPRASVGRASSAPPAPGAPPPAPAAMAPPRAASARPAAPAHASDNESRDAARRRRRRAAPGAMPGRPSAPPAPAGLAPERSFEALLGQLDTPLSSRLTLRLESLLDQLTP